MKTEIKRKKLEEERKHLEAEKKKLDIAKLPPKPKQPPSVVAKDGEIARDGRFIAYANGTILDTKTNLMWAAKDNGKGLLEHDGKDYIENYRGGGYTDWRMPTMDELETIYDGDMENKHGYYVTKLIDITGERIWGSEGWGNMWAFDFNRGSPAVGDWVGSGRSRDGHFYGARALPVRDSKDMKPRVVVKDEQREKKVITSAPRKTVITSLSPGTTIAKTKPQQIVRDGRFIAYADGTVLDTKTNLMWAATDAGEGLMEHDVDDYIKNYRGGGYTDWRLPTMEELEMIYDRSLKNRHSYYVTKMIDITGELVWGYQGWGNKWAFDFSRGSPAVAGRTDRVVSHGGSARALPVRAGN